jgi:general secretion pathway protein C
MTKLYYSVFNVIALSVLIFTGVDIFYRIVGSRLRQVNSGEVVMQQIPVIERHKKSRLSEYNPIMDRNLFGSLETESGEVHVEELEALEPTTLKVVLLGTVTGSEQNAFAVIEETDKRKQGLYRVGDSIQNAIVKMILRGKVIIRVGDKDEMLSMEEAAASRPELRPPVQGSVERGTTITVDRSDIQSSLENINELLSQVRVRPNYKDGESNGLRVDRIKPGSIFSKLGLRNGDIVQGINGEPIQGPDDILEMYENLKSGSSLSVQLNRRNRPETINYSFR